MLLTAQEFTSTFSDPPSPNEPTFITRPKLANFFSEEDSGSGYLNTQDLLKHDEVLSRELDDIPSHCPATSAPEPQAKDPFAASPLSYSFSAGDADLSQSPAALFLSSFSPNPAAPVIPEDAEGAVIAGYTLGPVIGVGGFSTIHQATSSEGGSVAVKIVRRPDLSPRARKRLDRETTIWRSLNHEHVLPLFSVTQTPHADYYVTLYCPAGTLFDILKRDGTPALPQDDAGMMFRQVVRGLRYLHEVAGVVHGDMKLENVLVDEMGVCRISDFGMARKIGEVEEPEVESSESSTRGTPATLPRRSHGMQGPLPKHLSLMRHSGPRHRGSTPLPSSTTTPTRSRDFPQGSLPYASPELLLPSSSTSYSPNPAQDIWALGVMLYTLLTGRLPFTDSYDPRLQMKILHGVYEMPNGIGYGAERVLTGCLERSVPNRWTIAMVDEIAWGVGWGVEGDDASPPPEVPSCVSSKSRSRSRVGVRLDANVIDDLESVQSPSSMTRSQSRSPSSARRASRSASRHAHVHHPYEPHQQLHHHHEHPPHPRPIEPSFSALTDAILRTNSADSDSSSSALNDSALLMTPSHPQRERGRLPRPKAQLQSELPLSDSRSVSPLEALLTPADSIQPSEAVDKSPAMGNIFSSMVEHPMTEVDEHWYGDDADAGHSASEQLRHVLEKDSQLSARRGSVPPLSVRTPFQCPSPSGPYTPATPRSIHQSQGTRSHSADVRPVSATSATHNHAG
ncbi:kinase-like protein [Daedalea quercina L-15889]|uniref:Kinase-like protein n=1 Tax=Daedalea quercina L-15889 TaxID=1314783 RepID=A0A165QKG7_9APHY|nr:kinase-like protein [Daedalea quercina L-15889]